jgi:AraC-like DNA-binding protein
MIAMKCDRVQCPASHLQPLSEFRKTTRTMGFSASPAEPAVTVFDLSDPAVAGADMELIDQDVVGLGPMPFRARRVIVRLESAAVMFHSVNIPVRARTSTHKGLLGFDTFGPAARGTVNGRPVRPGLMLAVAPGSQVNFVVAGGWESAAILVPPEDISAHLAARRREGEFRLPHGVEILQTDAVRARELFDWAKRLVNTAARQPALFDEGKGQQAAARVDLLEMLLATLRASGDFEPERSDRTGESYSRIVKTAEDCAMSHGDERLHVSDLCRAAAVSERTLEYAFKKIMGLTPMAYLMRVRLHRVRQALLAGSQGSTTVSAEALNWGFWHFGEFSRAYRACFGELPSDTLRRGQGRPQ